MIRPEILHTIISIKYAISFQTDKDGTILQSKQNSYSLPIIDEEKTKQNISTFIKSLCDKHTVPEILVLLMQCLDEVKFQYMLSHNGFRLAKNIPKDKRVSVADIYAFSSAVTYCFLFLPPENPTKPLTIVSGVMAPAGQDLGSSFLEQLWRTQGHEAFNLGVKVKPDAWLDAVNEHQPDFLSISCMLNTCIVNLKELFWVLSVRGDSCRVCVGGIAINKFKVLELSREYHIPIFYGHDLISIQAYPSPSYEGNVLERKTISLGDNTNLYPGENIRCHQIPISDVYIDPRNQQAGEKFLSYFTSAVIVTTSANATRKRDAKIIVQELLEIEKLIEQTGHLAYAFQYPIHCPFCLPKDCKENEGQCMNPAFFRPAPNIFHINVSKTIRHTNVENLELSTLILIK